jgi:hypothetical protein
MQKVAVRCVSGVLEETCHMTLLPGIYNSGKLKLRTAEQALNAVRFQRHEQNGQHDFLRTAAVILLQQTQT